MIKRDEEFELVHVQRHHGFKLNESAREFKRIIILKIATKRDQRLDPSSRLLFVFNLGFRGAVYRHSRVNSAINSTSMAYGEVAQNPEVGFGVVVVVVVALSHDVIASVSLA